MNILVHGLVFEVAESAVVESILFQGHMVTHALCGITQSVEAVIDRAVLETVDHSADIRRGC